MPGMVFPRQDPAYELVDYLDRRFAFTRVQPLWLGGEPGSAGSVVFPGGYIGCLPQNRVQWDPVEAEYWSGGSTLMDNLARDRYRLTTYMQQLAYPNSAGSTISAGSTPSWGSGAWCVGFSAGSPPGVYTVQDAIQQIWNQISVTTYTWTTIAFTYEGTLIAAVGKFQFAVPCALTIDSVYLRVQTAPAGQAIIVDVNKNGTTIFTNPAGRPQIAIGDNSGESGTPDVTSLVLNDYLTFDIDQAGSTTPGAYLSVHIRCKQYNSTE